MQADLKRMIVLTGPDSILMEISWLIMFWSETMTSVCSRLDLYQEGFAAVEKSTPYNILLGPFSKKTIDFFEFSCFIFSHAKSKL